MEILNFVRLRTESKCHDMRAEIPDAGLCCVDLRYEDLYIQMTSGFQSVTRTHCLMSNFVL